MKTETYNTINNNIAQNIMDQKLELTSDRVKGASFRTKRGRELVLTRDNNKTEQINREYIYIWTELHLKKLPV